MKGKTNAGSRDGFIGNDAILKISAPAESIVTITKGNITKSDHGHLNALNIEMYDYYFMIHASQFDSSNAWTVTATRNGISASKTIVIDRPDEYDLELLLKVYLRTGLDACSDITGGWTSVGKGWNSNYKGAQALTVTELTNPDGIYLKQDGSAKGGMYVTNNPIDLTRYSTLNFSGVISTYTNDNVQIQIMTETQRNGYIAASSAYVARYLPTANTTTTHTDSILIDISELNDSYYIGFIIYSNDATKYFNIYDLYLNP